MPTIITPDTLPTTQAALGRADNTACEAKPTAKYTAAQLMMCTKPKAKICTVMLLSWFGRMNCGNNAKNNSKTFGFKPLTQKPFQHHLPQCVSSICSPALGAAGWRNICQPIQAK